MAWTQGGGAHPVAQLAPNGHGLHDMSGNVPEWTSDAQAHFSDWDPQWGEDYPSESVTDPPSPGGYGGYTTIRV